MKKTFFLLFFFAYCITYSAVISKRLKNKLSNENIQELEIIILFNNQNNNSPNYNFSEYILVLQHNSQYSKDIFTEYIKNNNLQDEIKEIEFFWIANLAKLKCTPKFVEQIKLLDLIEYIDLDAVISPTKITYFNIIEKISTIQPGLKIVNADKLWKLGITGKGILVMNIDTGVDGYHPALKDRWYGNFTNPKYAWFDPKWNTPFPVDSSKQGTTGFGHGTHTMGTICGKAGNDTIGVAFDAYWIASNSIAGGNPHTSRTIAALQWAVNPDSNIYSTNDVPAVINCSWFDTSAEPCNNIYKQIFENLENLGIAVIFSAGNNGPGNSTISAPQSTVINKVNPFTVGNLDGTKYLNGDLNPIFNMSSRGPTTCSIDSELSIKPEVCAPGVDIVSSIPGNKYAKMTGTSMAAPHVSGVYALLKQAFPYKSPYQIKEAIYSSAKDLGPVGKDNSYGMGLIDAFAAAKYLDNKIPPTQITDLSLIKARSNSAIIKWTTPIDTSFGEIYGYDIRISNNPINRDNFSQAQKLFYNKNPKLPNSSDTLVIENLQPNTTYYVAIKSFDVWENISELSNILSFTTLGYPQIQLTKKSFTRTFTIDNQLDIVDTIEIKNISNNASYLEGIISLYEVNFDLRNQLPPIENTKIFGTYYFFKNTEFPNINIIPSYGNYLTPSWNNINSNYPTNDEGFAIIDFNDQEFEFYGKKFKKVYLSTNGFLTFDTITTIANRQNTAIPNSNSPNNLIAFFWDNLKLINKSTTKLYYIYKYIIIEGKDWALSIDTSDNQLLSFKILLNFYQNSITCAYDKVPQNTSSITIGIENSEGSDGVQVVYNNSSFKLNDGEIYKWIKYPKFVNFSNSKFAIQNGHKQKIIFTPNTEFIYPGYFNGKLLINSNDITKPVDTITVNYNVNFPTSIEQSNVKNYILYQNYPNPFNPFTTISYNLPKKDYVKIKIFDIKGSLIKTLFEGIQESGFYSFIWYGDNIHGKSVSSGVYFYQLETTNGIITKKMLLLK